MYLAVLCISHAGVDAISGAGFGQGEGRTWLTNLQCIGSEAELGNCATNSSEADSCTHAQDAGVRCGKTITPFFKQDCLK